MNHVDTRTITIASFCAGADGLGLGLRLVFPNARTVLYVEREIYACAVLEARIAEKTLDDAPIFSDVAAFDGKPWHSLVDIFSCGFSCQPWSVAGSRKGTADDRWVWPALAERIAEMGCPLVWLENVPGLIHGDGLQPVLHDLATMGYDAEWGCLSAGAVGASHERERVYILAWHAGWNARGLRILADAIHGTKHLSGCTEQQSESRKRGDKGPEHDAVSRGIGEDVADTRGSKRQAGSERLRRETGSDDDRRCAGTDLGNTQSNDQQRNSDGAHRQGESSRGSGGIVADTGSEGLQGSERRGTSGSGDGQEASGSTSELRSASVGDAGCKCGDGIQSVGQSECSETPTTRRTSSGVADSAQSRSGQLPESDRRHDSTNPEWSIPILCPGPNDTEAWLRILAVAPGLKPALCRVSDELADGMDFRADRLRVAGNGVHPLAAACAFTLLASRAMK